MNESVASGREITTETEVHVGEHVGVYSMFNMLSMSTVSQTGIGRARESRDL